MKRWQLIKAIDILCDLKEDAEKEILRLISMLYSTPQ